MVRRHLEGWRRRDPDARVRSPASIDAIAVFPSANASRLTGLDVIADGRTQRVAKRGSTIDVPLKGKPISKLVLKVATFDKNAAPAACIKTLQFEGDPAPGVVYGVSAGEAAALEPRVIAIRAALRTCTKLGDALAFPFTYARRTMTRNGLDEKKETFADVARATVACKRRQFAPLVKSMRLSDDTIVSSGAPGQVTVLVLDGDPWNLELRRGKWVLASVGDF